MTFQNKKIQKLISAIIIFSMFLPAAFLFSTPKKAEAGIPVLDWLGSIFTSKSSVENTITATSTTVDTGISIKNVAMEVLKEIAKAAARRVLASMTKATVNWINSGFHGNPLFLESPQSFFKDVAKYEIKNFVDTFGYDSRLFPFGRQIALDTINNYRQQSTANYEYSLSRVIDDPALLESYRTDFNTGGWNGFLLNTQYPQNNYLGSQLLATEYLARRLEGTVENKAQEVQRTLNQGMGFLSPKTCPSNPNYNNGYNEFVRPRFDAEKEAPWDFQPTVEPIINITQDNPNGESNPEYAVQLQAYNRSHADEVALAQMAWVGDNDCPGGLVATTPGSVVSASINKALGGSQDMVLGGVNYGNSLSLIFDTLINKFIDTGLNSLASNRNTPPVEDEWSYMGQTLGTVTPYNSTYWPDLPDEEIILAVFKKEVSDGIANTILELSLMNNTDPSNPGITQILGNTWPKVRELDMCLPGPDIGWEDRVLREAERNGTKLQEKSGDDDPEKAAAAKLTHKSLEYATMSFVDWVKTKMMGLLPGGISYLDEIENIEELHQQFDQLTDRKRAKTQALARLQSIQTNLSSFNDNDQPAPDSQREKDLINIRKQYNSVRSSISNSGSIENTRDELNTSKEKLVRISGMVTRCIGERQVQGWTLQEDATNATPYGRTSTLGNLNNAEATALLGGVGLGAHENEQQLLCNHPLTGGYSHESFKSTDEYVAYPDIPLVNGKNVLVYGGWPGLKSIGKIPGFGILPSSPKKVTIELNCNIIYRAYIFDYKANLPNPSFTVTDLPPDGVNSGGGTVDDEDNDDEGLTCSPSSQTVAIGQQASFNASGGDGEYTWYQNDTTPSTGSGSNFRGTWYEQTIKYVNLTDDSGTSTNCEVIVQ